VETERRLRAVFDTNIFVAAYLSKSPNSPTVELLQRWLQGEFERGPSRHYSALC
jgi:predicted nucleic acid-binding protein